MTDTVQSPNDGILFEGDVTFTATNPVQITFSGASTNTLFAGVGIKFGAMSRVHAVGAAMTLFGVRRHSFDQTIPPPFLPILL